MFQKWYWCGSPLKPVAPPGVSTRAVDAEFFEPETGEQRAGIQIRGLRKVGVCTCTCTCVSVVCVFVCVCVCVCVSLCFR